MSQAEWLDVVERARAQEELYLAEVEKSRMQDEAEALAQMKFIVSLHPVMPAGPLSVFVQALENLQS